MFYEIVYTLLVITAISTAVVIAYNARKDKLFWEEVECHRRFIGDMYMYESVSICVTIAGIPIVCVDAVLLPVASAAVIAKEELPMWEECVDSAREYAREHGVEWSVTAGDGEDITGWRVIPAP